MVLNDNSDNKNIRFSVLTWKINAFSLVPIFPRNLIRPWIYSTFSDPMKTWLTKITFSREANKKFKNRISKSNFDQLTRSFPAVYLVVAERHSWKFVQSTSNKHDEKVMMKNKSKSCLLYLVQNKIEMTWLVPFTWNDNRSFSRTRLFKTCFDRFLSIEEWFSILFSHRFFPIGQWFWTSSFCSKSKPKWTCWAWTKLTFMLMRMYTSKFRIRPICFHFHLFAISWCQCVSRKKKTSNKSTKSNKNNIVVLETWNG